MSKSDPRRERRARRFLLLFAVCAAAAIAAIPVVSAGADSSGDQTGLEAGKIKHVWLIIMENKSYDASFTGLNNNTYLWQELPKQGALLKNYYGTGHFSQDNYISMVSGQAPEVDTQEDCAYYDKFAGTVDEAGSPATNPNFGQMVSAQGPNAKAGTNGCVYPQNVPTLFNQLDAAGVSWKGYAQDLNNPDTVEGKEVTPLVHSAGSQYCGAPYSEPGPTGDTTFKNPGGANATDQYVPKHFPFPWFESLLDSGDCNSQHIANLFDPTDGLYHDLQSSATTPAFSWISPNNCSDAHDAVCHGNNLSGGFSDPNTPNAPVNYTGGLYAGDLFLEHVIPMIEESPAFKEGGLIDVTFDEGFPPFTYSGNSFVNSSEKPPTAATSLETGSAGETLYGNAVHYEPTGPNTPLQLSSSGQALYPGPGFNAFIHRPSNCVPQTVPSQPAGTCLLGGGKPIDTARKDTAATAPAGATTIADNAAGLTDAGRSVTAIDANGNPTGAIPAGAFVGQVTNSPVTATAPSQNGGFADAGSFTLVDAGGNPVATTEAVSGIELGARTAQTDPLFSYGGQTTGGGDTGSVLISPYIAPGTISTRFYNHYSWLRTMEDLFGVAGNSPGLDGEGHIGYAAQPGLAPFGSDVFTMPNGPGSGPSGGGGSTSPPPPSHPAPPPVHKKKHHKKHHRRKHHRRHHKKHHRSKHHHKKHRGRRHHRRHAA